MNPTKAAAIIALIVAVVAAAYLCFTLFENQVLLKAQNDAITCIELRTKYGGTYPCDEDNTALRYGISGGIALVGLITSLVLFGASNPRH